MSRNTKGFLVALGVLGLSVWIVLSSSGCATLPRCVIDTMTPPCSDEDGLVHKRMVENAKRINEDSMRRIREAWTGFLIISQERDFKKRRIAMVHDFDDRTPSWDPIVLEPFSIGRYKKKILDMSFEVPEDKRLIIPASYVTIWSKGKTPVTASVRYDQIGTTKRCVVVVPVLEMFAQGFNPCAAGVCGKIYKVSTNVRPISMFPENVCREVLHTPQH